MCRWTLFLKARSTWTCVLTCTTHNRSPDTTSPFVSPPTKSRRTSRALARKKLTGVLIELLFLRSYTHCNLCHLRAKYFRVYMYSKIVLQIPCFQLRQCANLSQRARLNNFISCGICLANKLFSSAYDQIETSAYHSTTLECLVYQYLVYFLDLANIGKI